MKPKVAVYKLSSCAGCQLELLNLEPLLLDVLDKLDFACFPMARRASEPGPYDIGLVEGAVTCGEEIEKLKAARDECRLLVAFGSCACFGGLPSIKNPRPEREIESMVYTDLKAIHSTKAFGIDQYVPVDGYLKGCPVSKSEVVDFVKSVLLNTRPALRPHSVCVECKLNENPCLFINEKTVCMGIVSNAGCGALCPSMGKACEGCRGPVGDLNLPSFLRTLKEYGLDEAAISRKFRKYAGEAWEVS